jgi:hypothetical protein
MVRSAGCQHTAEVARQLLLRSQGEARASIVDGDFFKDALPDGADIAPLVHVVDLFLPAEPHGSATNRAASGQWPPAAQSQPICAL